MIVNVVAVPVQPFALGVTVIVATIGLVVKLVAVKEEISPVPLAANPIAVELFVQEYEVPVTLNVDAKFTAVVAVLAHND